MSATEHPPQAYAAALAGLRQMTVGRLQALLLRGGSPGAAWEIACGRQPSGRPIAAMDDEQRRALRIEALATDPGRVWERCQRLGLVVTYLGDPSYPAVLADDLQPPPVLFAAGSLQVLQHRRAGIVGTRSATAAGRTVAHQLGRELAAAGVSVVSGLARGIDAAAHLGALGALGATHAAAAGPPVVGPAVGVIACGHDVIYPREHATLYANVAESGVLLSEVPPGTPPDAFRFPLRNRIVAALSEVVVVVESRHKGGSMITVNEAARRGVPVMAVPGAVCNAAAGGVNTLLRDGALVALEAADVLAVLAIDHTRSSVGRQPARPTAHADIYEACAGGARTIEQLVLHCDRSLAEVAAALQGLLAAGWLAEQGGWYEARGAPQ